MKICYICTDPGIPVFGRKGCSTHVRETCLILRELGHDVRLLTANDKGDDMGRDRLPCIKVEPYRSRKLGFDLRHILLDRRMEKAARWVFESWKPDAIYERYSLYSRAGTRLAAEYNMPHLLEINAMMTQEQKGRIKMMLLAKSVERKIFKNAKHVVVVSEPLREAVAKLRGSHYDISRIPMAVNLEHFSPSVDGTDIRRRFDLADRFVLGYVGTLTGWHGIDLLYDLAQVLRKTDVGDFAILVVGGDPRRLDRHRQKTEQLGLADVLKFIGNVPYTDVPKYMRAMDAAMVPDTTYWSSPAKLFEYQGCGIPVLAPRYPAIENAMSHESEGMIFEPRNVQEMAEHARFFCHNPEERRRMGLQGRRRAEADHSWEKLGHEVVEIFERQSKLQRAGRQAE